MSPGRIRVVIAGGGVAGVEAALAIRHLAPRALIEMLTLDAGFAYRQLSVVEPFTGARTGDVSYDALTVRGITVTQTPLARVDAGRHLVVLSDGGVRRYDALVVAVGAARRAAFPRGITFAGAAQTGLLHDLVGEVERGDIRRVVFVVPVGITWPLPLYELVLQLAARSHTVGSSVELRIVTPEPAPLEVFGSAVSGHVARLLERAGVAVYAGVEPQLPGPGLVLAGSAERPADRVIALALLTGRPISGLPANRDGFIPVDPVGRVLGLVDVFAIGDATDGTIKQGGVAAQQADRAAAALLGDAGMGVTAPTDPPELRAQLITGAETWYLRRRSGDPHGDFSLQPMWLQPSKVAGQHLSSFLAGDD